MKYQAKGRMATERGREGGREGGIIKMKQWWRKKTGSRNLFMHGYQTALLHIHCEVYPLE